MSPNVAAEALAEDAVLLRFGDAIDPMINARVNAAAQALRVANLTGVTDIAPAYATLLLRFDPLAWEESGSNATPADTLIDAVRDCLGPVEDAVVDAGPGVTGERHVEIPVCYGGDHGPDLAAVAAYAHLSVDEVVACHTTAEYTVAMLGFAPGFPYLLGLDPALDMPRRATPRTRVPAGSVAIGGSQTGIYPCELPGGWNLIGCTPLVLFDPRREEPCLLAPGQRVRFRAIEPDEFDALRAEYERE